MPEKHPISKLKRRKTSVEESKSEQHNRPVPRDSIGRVLAPKDLQPSCNVSRGAAAVDGSVVRGAQDWLAQPSLPPLERLWALTLQAFSAQIPEPSGTEQLPELPLPHTKTCVRAKQAEWRWCCLGDEVGALPERPAVEQRVPASSASAGQPVPVPIAPANAVPTTDTTCLSPPVAPEPDRACAGASSRTRDAASRKEEAGDNNDAKMRSGGSVSVPTEVPQRCHQGGNKEQRGIATATSRPSASSTMGTADTRAKVIRRESAAGTAATATAGVTLDTFFGAGRGAERGGRGGRGGGGGGVGEKEAAIKQRPTDQWSGTPAPPTPSSGQQGASAGAGGVGVGGLDCCPMCLMPFPAGFSQMDCDGHLAQCLSEMNADMVW